MQELQIDFETLGTDPDTVVISVGAQFFDLETKTLGPSFHMAFDISDQLKKGRSITPETLKWWMSQSDAAKKVFHAKARPTQEVLQTFVTWAKSNCGKKNLKVWGNGVGFDISIMESLLTQFELEIPWMYWNCFDLRTFKRFVANNEKIEKSIGVNHDALDDCTNQIQFMFKHYKPAT